MFILIWGKAGVGKTTLACTAPGEKLVINFDPNGPASVAGRGDVSVLDYSAARTSLTDEFKRPDPFGISKHLEQFDTVIIDSLSSIEELTTRQGVAFAQSIGIKSFVENPSPTAYGARNALVLELVRNMMSVCSTMKKHLILIGHEAGPLKDKEGSIVSIPLMLGGKLPVNVSVKLSEIWTMYDADGGKRKLVGIRPARMREIAKTRMFITTGSPEFTWAYDPEKGDEAQVSMTIADWHRQWIDNGKRKISLPK